MASLTELSRSSSDDAMMSSFSEGEAEVRRVPPPPASPPPSPSRLAHATGRGLGPGARLTRTKAPPQGPSRPPARSPPVLEADRPAPAPLEQELQRALVGLRALREENGQLRRNFESLKGIHVQLNAAHKEVLEQVGGLQGERVAREGEITRMIDALTLELDDAKRRFDEVAPHILQPPPLRALQANLRKEVEEPLRQRIGHLEAQLQEKGEAYNLIWKDNQLLQASMGNAAVKAQNDLARETAKFAVLMEEKDKTVKQLTRLANSRRDPDLRLKTAERKAAELDASVTSLQRQLDEALEAKTRSEVEKMRAWTEINQEKARLKQNEIQKERSIGGYERRAQHLESELHKAMNANESLNVELRDAQKSCNALRNELEKGKAVWEAEGEAMRRNHAAVEASWDAQKLQLEDRTADLERTLDRLRRDHAAEVSSLGADKAATAKAEAAKVGRELRRQADQLAEAQAKLEGEEALRKQERETYEKALEALQKDLGVTKAAGMKSEAEAQAVNHMKASYQKEIEALQAETLAKRKEIGDLHVQMRKLSASQAEISDLAREKGELLSENELLKKQVQNAKSANSQSYDDSRSHIESLKRTWAVEKSAMARQLQEVTSTMESKQESVVRRMKRKMERYQSDIVNLERSRAAVQIKLTEMQTMNAMLQRKLNEEFGQDDIASMTRRQAFQRELEKLEGDAFQLPQTPTESASSIEAY